MLGRALYKLELIAKWTEPVLNTILIISYRLRGHWKPWHLKSKMAQWHFPRNDQDAGSDDSPTCTPECAKLHRVCVVSQPGLWVRITPFACVGDFACSLWAYEGFFWALWLPLKHKYVARKAGVPKSPRECLCALWWTGTQITVSPASYPVIAGTGIQITVSPASYSVIAGTGSRIALHWISGYRRWMSGLVHICILSLIFMPCVWNEKQK